MPEARLEQPYESVPRQPPRLGPGTRRLPRCELAASYLWGRSRELAEYLAKGDGGVLAV